ncbi:MAG TPA: flagellar hook-length control protein FliK [Falsiroseomonas sp.]|jgi:hypothetical protein|nr:flagellar hook-length control protein FliK [Falsiroseomonas sp.]
MDVLATLPPQTAPPSPSASEAAHGDGSFAALLAGLISPGQPTVEGIATEQVEPEPEAAEAGTASPDPAPTAALPFAVPAMLPTMPVPMQPPVAGASRAASGMLHPVGMQPAPATTGPGQLQATPVPTMAHVVGPVVQPEGAIANTMETAPVPPAALPAALEPAPPAQGAGLATATPADATPATAPALGTAAPAATTPAATTPAPDNAAPAPAAPPTPGDTAAADPGLVHAVGLVAAANAPTRPQDTPGPRAATAVASNAPPARGVKADAPAEFAAQRANANSAPPPNTDPALAAPTDRAPEPVLGAAPPEPTAPPAPHPASPEPAGVAAQPTSAAPAASTPEPAPTRPGAPIPWPARQVASFAVALALGPDASINLTLEPGELGRVEVAIERKGAEALISLRAERPETLALLQRDRAELERALADAGFGGGEGRGTTLSFSLGGDGAQGRERRGDHGASAERKAVETATPIKIPAATARGLLDLAV